MDLGIHRSDGNFHEYPSKCYNAKTRVLAEHFPFDSMGLVLLVFTQLLLKSMHSSV